MMQTGQRNRGQREDMESKKSWGPAVGRSHCWEGRLGGPRESSGVKQDLTKLQRSSHPAV